MQARQRQFFADDLHMDKLRSRAEKLSSVLKNGAQRTRDVYNVEPNPCDTVSAFQCPYAKAKYRRRLAYVMAWDAVNSVRAPSSRPKKQKRHGAKQVKLVEQQQRGKREQLSAEGGQPLEPWQLGQIICPKTAPI